MGLKGKYGVRSNLCFR